MQRFVCCFLCVYVFDIILTMFGDAAAVVIEDIQVRNLLCVSCVC